MSTPILYDYRRSSASYRVRLALAQIDLPHDIVPVDLRARAHRSAAHLARNPQGLVPALWIDGRLMTQSLAIIEYLDETRSALFLPDDPAGRARVRQLAHIIAMEIHPVCNLSVAQRAAGEGPALADWMRDFIGRGLAAFEQVLDDPETGRFCHGDQITLADLCLLPQLCNADRWGVDRSAMPRIGAVEAALKAEPALAKAHPDA